MYIYIYIERERERELPQDQGSNRTAGHKHQQPLQIEKNKIKSVLT